MNEKPTSPPSLGMTLADIYYVLFRHKWKIALISTAGLVAALLLPAVWRLPYQSEAKLFVRYVLESKSPGQVGASDAKVKSPDERGENVINTELEILTSLDLAQEVVANIGPEKILARAGGGGDYDRAAGLIRRNLLAEVPKKSSVIRILFQHPDPAIVQPVLDQLINVYLKRHVEIHRAVGVFDDFLTQETDQLRSRLVQTEAELRRAKTNAHVISLEDTKKTFTEQMSKIQQAIFDAEAELAERKAAVAEPAKVANTETSTASNTIAAIEIAPVPSEKIAEYKKLSGLLEVLTKREQELSIQFTAENPLLKSTQEQITGTEKLKKQLEEENPGLLALKVPRVAALDSKIRVLTGQLDKIRKEATVVDEMEGSITELQRKKELEEAHYKYFSASLEQSRIDEALGAGRVSNINKIQAPSPPFRDGTKLQKARVMLLIGSIAGAIALAFLLEFYLDRSLKRPIEIEARLGVPLFLSIPWLSRNGKPHILKAARRIPLLPQNTGDEKPADHESEPPEPPANGEVAPWDPKHKLRPFSEALRDRLITYFEIKNLTHKPKLVAVTSCTEGSGVTTIAAGLAASLSETGDGNVLLVDMNLQGAAHQFYKGSLACGLDDALEVGKRDRALVQDNLYVVTEATNGDKLPRVLPKRFTHLVPKLKASDYDYIIFDMPPISQISVTPRLARFMDMVLLVVESEKTDRDVVKRATTLLSESKANVGVVLNKGRTYVPRQLQQEL